MGESYFCNSNFVTEITPSYFLNKSIIKIKNNECAAILFYIPGCHFCEGLKDVWEEVAKKNLFYKNILAFNVAEFRPFISEAKDLQGGGMIKGFPAILVYKGGEFVEQIGIGKDPKDTLYKRSFEGITSDLIRICKKGN